MSGPEEESESSPTSTDNQVEDKDKDQDADQGDQDSQAQLGLTTEGGEVIPGAAPKPRAKKVAMVNGRKFGRVFPNKDVGYGPGETYHCSETIAKKMEQIPGQYRV